MKSGTPLFKYLAMALLLGAAIFSINWILQENKPASIVQVRLPELSAEAQKGGQLFNENCAACHGENAGGSNQGPPLIHKFYQIRHHGNEAFMLAVARGVRRHHWQFGNMPPQPQVSQNDTLLIIGYLRELQKANDIF